METEQRQDNASMRPMLSIWLLIGLTALANILLPVGLFDAFHVGNLHLVPPSSRGGSVVFLVLLFVILPRRPEMNRLVAVSAVGLAVIALAVALAGSALYPAFYLAPAGQVIALGAAVALAGRQKLLRRMFGHLADRSVNRANRVFRGLIVIFFGGALLVPLLLDFAEAAYDGKLDMVGRPEWTGWPYVAAFILGWVCFRRTVPASKAA